MKGMWKRGLPALVVGLVLLGSASTSLASVTETTLLGGPGGEVELTVEVWDPTEPGTPNPGYFSYEYEMRNLSLAPYVSWLNIYGDSVEEWNTPSNWTFSTGPSEPFGWDHAFGWDADPGFELGIGETLGGFGIKSDRFPALYDCAYVEGETQGDWASGETLGPVPEPATLSLLALGGVALRRRRRRLTAK